MGEAIEGIIARNILINKLFPVAIKTHKVIWWLVNICFL